MTTITVSSGTTTVNTPTTDSYLVEGSGTLDVVSGGVVSGLITVSSGGTALVGRTDDTVLAGTTLDTILYSGGTGLITDGTALNTTISSGGLQVISYVGGGFSVAISTIIASGGTQNVEYDLASDTVVSGGTQLVEGGATSTVVIAGEEYVSSYGRSLAAQIDGGAVEILFGSDSGASLSGTSAATATQYDFGIALGGTTFENGLQEVASGATASAMDVESGGEQYIGSGGTAQATNVGSQGAEVVFGIDDGANVSGTQYDFDYADGGTIYNNAYELVAPDATATSMAVESGGEQYIGSAGVAIATSIAVQGAEVVFGTDVGALISGTQYDFNYAGSGAIYNNAYELVAPDAIASGMTVESGGEQYIGSAGVASATKIAAQGAEVVFGTDVGALISGTQYDFNYAGSGTIYNDAYELVAAGAIASGMMVESGGEQYIGAGGTAIDTGIFHQGAEVVHGMDVSATVIGTQYIYGLTSGAMVSSGGYQLIESGGTINGATISSGTIEITSGASEGAAYITFSGPGELILDASTSFSGTVAGFASASLDNSIDFADIPYVAAGSAGATTLSWTQQVGGTPGSGTLIISQGGHAADITLLGQYVTANFALSSDGRGGTLVTDPPIAAATDPNPLVLAAARQA